MSYVHVLSEGPTRIRSTVMRGDEVEMSVTIAGRWDIVGDDWEARLYGKGRYWSMGVSRSIATVDSADDSTTVTLTLSAAHCAQLTPGKYVFTAKDTTLGTTWVRGVLVVQRNVLVA